MTNELATLLAQRERLSPTARAAVARAMLRLEELAAGARQRASGPVWLDGAEEPDPRPHG